MSQEITNLKPKRALRLEDGGTGNPIQCSEKISFVRGFSLDERFFSHVKNVVRSFDCPELIFVRKCSTQLLI